MKLEITKERIFEAAAKCSTAKQTLQTLFPEAFEDEKYFDLTFNQFLKEQDHDEVYCDKTYAVRIRVALGLSPSESFRGKVFHLSNDCNWEIKKFETETYLIPTKK